jgi:glycosyltransferase involved in cell wall biosynthesis
MRPASIALLHYTCPPIVGGVEEILDQQASLFFRHGHPVRVMTGRGGRKDRAYEVEINPLLDSRHSDILRIQKRIPDHRSEFRSLVDALFRYLQQALKGFDVLIAHNVLTMAYNLPLTYTLHKLADAKTTRIVAWNHDSPFFYPGLPDYLGQAPWKILKRSHPAIRYIAISESRKRQFLSLFGRRTRVDVIPNGIDPFQFYQLDSATARFIRENRLLDSDLLMVQPSRLHPRKNIELSIRVLRALHDRGVKARLLVTGSYDPHENKDVRYYNRLRNLAQELMIDEHVLMISEHDFQGGNKFIVDKLIIRDLYLIADILFLPSLQEGFGLPLLEAGLMKLPVFCSEIPPFREIGGNDISTFALDDPPEKIADQILAWAARPGPLSLYRRVIRHHVWDNIYDSLLLPFINSLTSGS